MGGMGWEMRSFDPPLPASRQTGGQGGGVSKNGYCSHGAIGRTIQLLVLKASNQLQHHFLPPTPASRIES